MTGARALVVDDDPAVRRALVDMLASFGVLSSQVADPSEALALLKHEPVDFILLDIHFPGENGVSLAEQAMSLQPEAATIIITGHPSLSSSIEAMRLGAADYLLKPISLDALRAAMQRAWRQRGARGSRRVRQPDAQHGTRLRDTFVVSSAEMRNVRAQSRRLAELDKPIVVMGEKGTGRSRLAHLIHEQSARGEGPFVHFRCNSMREASLDTGTGASESRSAGLPSVNPVRGAFDLAIGGTLLLADVDKLPLWGQVRLLECMDRDRIPASRFTSTAPRIIATTASELKELAERGDFSSELYFRLNVATVRVPPLRQRSEDIRPLATCFLGEQQRLSNRPTPHTIAEDAWQALIQYSWPGNVAELANVIERAVVHASGDVITLNDLSGLLTGAPTSMSGIETITIPVMGDLKAMERQIVREVIHRCSGNKAAAARRLGMHRKTIYRLLQDDAAAIS